MLINYTRNKLQYYHKFIQKLIHIRQLS